MGRGGEDKSKCLVRLWLSVAHPFIIVLRSVRTLVWYTVRVLVAGLDVTERTRSVSKSLDLRY